MPIAPIRIPRFQIFPAIGVARVGDSQNHTYVASEAPDIDFVPVGGYRGDPEPTDRLVKRMGCRFRIYEFDENTVLREVTNAVADIEWRVRLVNKKATGDADWGYETETGALNPQPSGWPQSADAWISALTIDSGIETMTGPGVPLVELGGEIMEGTPEARYVKLGDIETDNSGRLVVYGGHGEAGSWRTPAADPDGVRNRGWYDDTSDGIVAASVTIGGEEFEATEARIVVGPPDYAHPCLAPVTLFDLAFDRIGGFRDPLRTPSFKDDIHPILHRSAFLEWTLFAIEGGRFGRTPKHGHGFTGNHDMHPDGGFLDGDLFRTLRANIPALPDYAEGTRRRTWYLEKLKVPDDPTLQSEVQGVDNNMPAINGLTFTMTQFGIFEKFAADDYDSDWPAGRAPRDLDQPIFAAIPLADQPEALNRAAMDCAVGGPFLPGVEVGAVAADEQTYTTAGLLDPRIDFRVTDPGTIEAGDLTKSLAVPWQVGFNQHNYRMPNADPADNLWPSARTVLVPAKRSGASDDMRWTRPYSKMGGSDIFESQKMRTNLQMIENWSKLGFIAPATFYIEVARTLQEDPNWPI